MFKRIPWKTSFPARVPPDMVRNLVYIGLGTNIGTAGQQRRILHLAIGKLHRLPVTRVVAVSSLYETPAWGFTDQADFTNGVAAIKTGLSPLALLHHLKLTEHQLGRKMRERWGPREIDLDILLFGSLKISREQLTVPHKHMREREFVRVPLHEIAAGALKSK